MKRFLNATVNTQSKFYCELIFDLEREMHSVKIALARICMGIVLFFGIQYDSFASVGSIIKNRYSLHLIDKVGKAENLLNNPAQLGKIKHIIIDDFFNFNMLNSQDNEMVFRLVDQTQTLQYSTQVILPLLKNYFFNMGYTYTHLLDMQNTLNSNDGSVFSGIDNKMFKRIINAGGAIKDVFDKLDFGYSVSKQSTESFVERYWDSAAVPKVYLNQETALTHTLGVTFGEFEVFANYSAENDFSFYQGVQEIDFSLNHLTLNLRHLMGDVDQENLVTLFSYTQSDLAQNQFDAARTYYQLDLPKYQVELDNVYYCADRTFEFAAGAELEYESRNVFDFSKAQFLPYQVYQASIPSMLSNQLLPFLKVWTELELNYLQNTWRGSKSLGLQESFGLRMEIESLEVNIYTTPLLQWLTSNQEANVQSAIIGVDLILRF